MESLLRDIDHENIPAPDDDGFALWRAVFSLVHVDGVTASAEHALVERVMEIFNFTDPQRASIQSDMDGRGQPVKLFQDIQSDAHRRQFFRLARVVIWCDGLLHEDEMQAIEDVKESLGESVSEYETELKWMGRKPDLPFGESASSPEEEMMKHIIYQMSAFYKEVEAS